ncbi:hypothetical protein ACA910_006677 [Epithemia clementina (nom. ined.)]
MSILRLSDFCAKPFEPQRVEIKVISGTGDSPADGCPISAVTNFGLLRRLAVAEGSLVLIRRWTPLGQLEGNGKDESGTNNARICNDFQNVSLLWQKKQQITIAVRLFAVHDMNDNRDESKDTIYIHLLTAINLGIVPTLSSDGTDEEPSAIDEFVVAPELRRIQELPVAQNVTLRQWGRPLQLPSLFQSKRANNKSKTLSSSNSNDAWAAPTCFLQPGKLVAVSQHDSGDDAGTATVSYYQIVEVLSDTDKDAGMEQSLWVNKYVHKPDVKTLSDNISYALFRSDRNTLYRFETMARPWNSPRLPSLFGHSSPPPPHPNVSQFLQAMRLPATATPSQRILVALGAQLEHDIDCAVRTAATHLGRQCLVVQGLAAHAHRCTGLVRSASLVDKLAGMKIALDQAFKAAPCVLLVMDFDLEFTRQDIRLCHDEESRFWSILTSSVNGIELTATLDHGLAEVPSVIVILSMTQMPPRGPLLEHLIWEPIRLLRPDSAYGKFLWNRVKAPPLAGMWSLLQGRTAEEITELAQQVAEVASFLDGEEIDAMSLLQTQIEKLNKQGRSQTSMSLIPQVKWGDVGGLDHVRNEILETIELPLRYPKLFSTSTAGRSGVLLYGPPGTGKTLVAKAVANECGLPFVSIKGPELLGTYVGESEANVRAVFTHARKLARQSIPKCAAILFFDELDSLAPRRADVGGGGGASVMDRVVATLFAELDRPRGEGDCNIYCIGATNRPDMLDPALLRPGRLDRIVYLGLSDLDRRKILEVHLSKLKLQEDLCQMVELVHEKLASKHLSGADLASVASNALMLATQRLCDQAEAEAMVVEMTVEEILALWDRDKLEPIVQVEDLIAAAEDLSPGMDENQLAQYEEMRNQMESNR